MMAKYAAILSLALLAILAFSRLAAAQDPPNGVLDDVIPTAPVELDGSALFRVRGVSSFPAETRARLISQRIAAVAHDHRVTPDALHVITGPGVSRIVANEQ